MQRLKFLALMVSEKKPTWKCATYVSCSLSSPSCMHCMWQNQLASIYHLFLCLSLFANVNGAWFGFQTKELSKVSSCKGLYSSTVEDCVFVNFYRSAQSPTWYSTTGQPCRLRQGEVQHQMAIKSWKTNKTQRCPTLIIVNTSLERLAQLAPAWGSKRSTCSVKTKQTNKQA